MTRSLASLPVSSATYGYDATDNFESQARHQLRPRRLGQPAEESGHGTRRAPPTYYLLHCTSCLPLLYCSKLLLYHCLLLLPLSPPLARSALATRLLP